jgi:hypothetical protein
LESTASLPKILDQIKEMRKDPAVHRLKRGFFRVKTLASLLLKYEGHYATPPDPTITLHQLLETSLGRSFSDNSTSPFECIFTEDLDELDQFIREATKQRIDALAARYPQYLQQTLKDAGKVFKCKKAKKARYLDLLHAALHECIVPGTPTDPCSKISTGCADLDVDVSLVRFEDGLCQS